VETPSNSREPAVLFDSTVSARRIRRASFVGAVLISLALALAFFGFEVRAEQLLRRQQIVQARAFTREIIATRQFVAIHGGVYVPASRDTTVNPFLLAVPGLQTKIVDSRGRTFVLQNPALVTIAVGSILSKDPSAGISFRLSSDRPLNPANRATGFEAEAIRRFQRGATEFYRQRREAGTPFFLYAQPLRVEAQCMQCHRQQGYRVGDVRGAISLRVTSVDLEAGLLRSRALVGLSLVVALVGLLLLLELITRQVSRRLLSAEAELRQVATLDALTGLENRRAGMKRLGDEMDRADRSGEPLAVIVLDLDEFKRVNDEFGHAEGDAVLVGAADGMRAEARHYDGISRSGGEEFLMLLPGANADAALAIAERVRHAVAGHTAAVLGGKRGAVTVSAGVAVYEPASGESRDDVLSRADRGMYAAKDAGRDAVRLAV